MKILVVDDNRDNVELLCQILEDEENDVIKAYSGAECIKLAKEEQPDLIILDVLMPEMDGYEVLARLKENENTKEIPVIFLSAHYKDTDRVIKGLDIGAFDYITKPFKEELLLAKVRVVERVKHAEYELKRKSDELEKMNRELQAEIIKRKVTEKERERISVKLNVAQTEIKTLSGLLPICSNCKKVRDDKGYWNQIEVYIRDHSEAEFSHCICPDCEKKLYPEFT